MFLKKTSDLVLKVRLKMKQRGANASRLAVVGLVGVGALIMTFQNCARYAAKNQSDSTMLSSVASTALSDHASCYTPNGQVKKSGESFNFAKNQVGGASGCQYLARVCSNGQWLGDASYMYGQCVESDGSCTFDGSVIPTGGQTSKLYFKSDRAPLGKTCADVSNASKLKCLNGAVQGLATYPYSSCHEGCTLNGIAFRHGDITQDFFFKQPTVTSGTCFDNGNASQLVCQDGQMKPKDGSSGTFAYGKCIVETGTGSTAGTGSTGTSGTPGTGTGNTSGATTKRSCTVGTGTTAVTYKDGDNIDHYYKKEAVLPGTMCSDNGNMYIQKCSDGVVNPPPAADLVYRFRGCHTMTASNDPRLVHIIRYYFADRSKFVYTAIRGSSAVTLRSETQKANGRKLPADAFSESTDQVKKWFDPSLFVFKSDDITVESIINLRDEFLLTEAKKFNALDYGYLNSDVQGLSLDLRARHFEIYGAAEMRSPNILFNAVEYSIHNRPAQDILNSRNDDNGCYSVTQTAGGTIFRSLKDGTKCVSAFKNYFVSEFPDPITSLLTEVQGATKPDFYIQFDEHAYLFNPNNVDVLDAVIHKTDALPSGMVHYLRSGRNEANRPPALVPLSGGHYEGGGGPY